MRAVITGAASGIGRAVALRLAGDGWQLLLVDRSEDGLTRVAEEVSARGAVASTVVVDLARADAGDEVASAAGDRLGGVDALVSNAGVMTSGALEELSLETYDLGFAVNTRAMWVLAKALLPFLRDARGSIVATASISGHEPTPPLGAYSASKAALMMLVRQLAFEWGSYGIRCNSVSPGMVETAMTKTVYADPALAAARAAAVPLGRVAQPEDIAGAIAFLLSADASYISGIDLLVDGGLRTTFMPAIRGVVPVTP